MRRVVMVLAFVFVIGYAASLSMNSLPARASSRVNAVDAKKKCSVKIVKGKKTKICRTVKPKPTPTPSLARGMKVDVGGYRLFIQCVGQGSPTLMLEAGLGGTSVSWLSVEPSLGAITRTCVYDRAGSGASEAPSGDNYGGTAIVRDLHTLLANAGVPGPYVLVGHSMGGLLVRLFAYTYPADVTGLVLIDSSYEGQCAVYGCDSPSVDQVAEISLDVQAATRGVVKGSLGDRPLMVLTRGQSVDPAWEQFQADLATASTNSVHVVVVNSGHTIQQDDPPVVVEAAKEVVEAARSPSHLLPACGQALESLGARCAQG